MTGEIGAQNLLFIFPFPTTFAFQAELSYPGKGEHRHDKNESWNTWGSTARQNEWFTNSNSVRRSLIHKEGGAFALSWWSRPGQLVPAMVHSTEKGYDGMESTDKTLSLTATGSKNTLPPELSKYLYVRWRQWLGLPGVPSKGVVPGGLNKAVSFDKREPPALNRYNLGSMCFCRYV